MNLAAKLVAPHSQACTAVALYEPSASVFELIVQTQHPCLAPSAARALSTTPLQHSNSTSASFTVQEFVFNAKANKSSARSHCSSPSDLSEQACLPYANGQLPCTSLLLPTPPSP